MPSKKRLVKFEVLEVLSDRIQYKPYSARLGGMGKVFVELEVDAEDVRADGDEAVLSVDGLAQVLMKVADTIETAHEQYRVKKYGH
jgi:hypothetical protein